MTSQGFVLEEDEKREQILREAARNKSCTEKFAAHAIGFQASYRYKTGAPTLACFGSCVTPRRLHMRRESYVLDTMCEL